MHKVKTAFTLTTIALVALVLSGCDRSKEKEATPSPTPEPTATSTPLPNATPSLTATPVAVLTTPMPAASPVALVTGNAAASPTPLPSVPPLPPVTDPAILSGELNAPTFIGRRADLAALKVDWLVGDRAFYVEVGDSNRRMLVILDTKLNQGAADAGLKILPGQTLSIQGVIEKLPGEQEIADKWGVRGKETEPLKGEIIYLHADHVVIDKGPGAK